MLIVRSRKGRGSRFIHDELVVAEAPRKQNQLTTHPGEAETVVAEAARKSARGRQVGLEENYIGVFATAQLEINKGGLTTNLILVLTAKTEVYDWKMVIVASMDQFLGWKVEFHLQFSIKQSFQWWRPNCSIVQALVLGVKLQLSLVKPTCATACDSWEARCKQPSTKRKVTRQWSGNEPRRQLKAGDELHEIRRSSNGGTRWALALLIREDENKTQFLKIKVSVRIMIKASFKLFHALQVCLQFWCSTDCQRVCQSWWLSWSFTELYIPLWLVKSLLIPIKSQRVPHVKFHWKSPMQWSIPSIQEPLTIMIHSLNSYVFHRFSWCFIFVWWIFPSFKPMFFYG